MTMMPPQYTWCPREEGRHHTCTYSALVALAIKGDIHAANAMTWPVKGNEARIREPKVFVHDGIHIREFI